jgi:hypothetical protein
MKMLAGFLIDKNGQNMAKNFTKFSKIQKNWEKWGAD